jgi:two-component system, chemotaxis family, protein-glutamate methylesterase/glutaminase
MGKKIRVLIVEDSIVKRELLSHILNSDPDIDVVATASNGETAIAYIKEKKPDLATMDINMPGISGYETTRRILRECPIPIIMISTIRTTKNKAEVSKAMMESGALSFIDTPPGPWHEDFKKQSDKIIRTAKLMSSIKVITRRETNVSVSKNKRPYIPPLADKKLIIAIGVSTGGPPLLQEILEKLPSAFSIPIVIVQHISVGFDAVLANNLNRTCRIKVKLGEDGERLKKGTVYIAPGEYNLAINNPHTISLIKNPTSFNKIVPSADALLNSVAKSYGKSAVGILLTGMGRDGAKELKSMKNAGAVTIIQDEASSVVYGMPFEAKRINAEKHIMTPKQIADYLLEVNKNG